MIDQGYILAALVLAAVGLRIWDIGGQSFWYDEVVTMRLARTENASALIRLLGEIDATRAPLHPLLLQPWVQTFGASEISGRAFSGVCGVLTVAIVFRLGRRLFDDRETGLIAAVLAAVSPLLVLYSREARMYAWLVLATCFAWDALLSLSSGWTRLAIYALGLVVLVFSHPLGLLMFGALALASAINRRALGLSWSSWLGVHLVALAFVAPWVGRYFDHDPESTVGRLPLRFLFGLPIGYIGGNFATLLGFAAVIVYGLLTREDCGDGRPGFRIDHPLATSCLVIWLVVPPLMLYTYSLVSHSIFGPARYTLFVAPAYLILVARGMSKLPTAPKLGVLAAALVLSALLLRTMVFAPDLKADWRAAATFLTTRDPTEAEPVIVISNDPAHNVEVVTAHYYLGPRRPIFPDAIPPGASASPSRLWLAVGLRDHQPVSTLPERVVREGAAVDFPGLQLIAAKGNAGGSDRASP